MIEWYFQPPLETVNKEEIVPFLPASQVKYSFNQTVPILFQLLKTCCNPSPMTNFQKHQTNSMDKHLPRSPPSRTCF